MTRKELTAVGWDENECVSVTGCFLLKLPYLGVPDSQTNSCSIWSHGRYWKMIRGKRITIAYNYQPWFVRLCGFSAV